MARTLVALFTLCACSLTFAQDKPPEKPLTFTQVGQWSAAWEAILKDKKNTDNPLVRRELQDKQAEERKALCGKSIEGIAVLSAMYLRGKQVTLSISVPVGGTGFAVTIADSEDPILKKLVLKQAVFVRGTTAKNTPWQVDDAKVFLEVPKP